MKSIVVLLLPCALLVSGCQNHKAAPTAPSPTAVADAEPGPAAEPVPAQQPYPNDGPGVIAYVVAKYPEKLAADVSGEERMANMQFLRDRVIEVGKCGGLDLGWNLKRGGPEVSNDFIAERVGGTVVGHDIAFDYDNTSHPLQMYWGGGDFPAFKEYPQPACN